MKALILNICLSLSIALSFGQNVSKKSDTAKLTIEDGWHVGQINCYSTSSFVTKDIYRYKWVKVENEIVVFIGEHKNNTQVYNLLDSYNLTRIPHVKRQKGQLIAKMSFAAKNADSGSNIIDDRYCTILIDDSDEVVETN